MPNENTDPLIINTVKDILGIELQPTDMDRDGENATKPRGIVVKFIRYNVRQRGSKPKQA